MYKAVLANNPAKTVKLTPTSSGTRSPRHPSRPICCDKTPMRPNRPHIPSIPSMSKSHRQTKNVRSANFLAYPLAPCLQIFRTSALSCPRRDPSPSRFRFGEGVFTDAARCPQEQKTPIRQKICDWPKTTQNLVVDERNAAIDAVLWQFSCPGRMIFRGQAIARRAGRDLRSRRSASSPTATAA